MSIRDQIRANIFADGNRVPAKREITLFGEKVEIRQPTLAQINKLSRSADEKTPAIVKIMIEYMFVPGTDEKVFDAADAAQLAEMPSGKWLTDMNNAIEELTGVDVKAAEKNSEETASGSQSSS